MSTLQRVFEEHYKLFGKKPYVIASAPGRIDFLNTHQDYKGLPVVSVAVNMRTYIALSESEGKSHIISLNLMHEGLPYIDVFSINNLNLLPSDFFGNYLRATLLLFKEKYKLRINDLNILIHSEIPIGAGLASSATLIASFIKAIDELYGLGLKQHEIAEDAYIAEHEVLGIPCGRLDQYASAIGGVLIIKTKPPVITEKLPIPNGLFLVIDSGIRHKTINIHSIRQKELKEALEILCSMQELGEGLKQSLCKGIDEVEWEKLDLRILNKYLYKLPENLRNRIVFTIKMNESTKLAIRVLRGKTVSINELIKVLGDEYFRQYYKSHNMLDLIGLFMNYQHILLRDYYEVSHPFIEEIRNYVLKLGAYGVKLSGAGLGGSLIALTSNYWEAENILKQVKLVKKVRGWIIRVEEEGVRTEYVLK